MYCNSKQHSQLTDLAIKGELPCATLVRIFQLNRELLVGGWRWQVAFVLSETRPTLGTERCLLPKRPAQSGSLRNQHVLFALQAFRADDAQIRAHVGRHSTSKCKVRQVGLPNR